MRFWLFVLFTVLIVLYLNRQHTANTTQTNASLFNQIMHPFDNRVHYRIGHIDPRFGLSAEQLADISREAAGIWQQGTGKALFIEDESARLTINLIYDERQAETNLRNSTQQTLQQEYDSQQQHSVAYKQQQQQLTEQRRQIDLREVRYKEQLANYNRSIESWNVLGSLDEFNRQQLEQQRRALDTEMQDIQQAIEHYNQQINTLNQTASNLNQHAQDFNRSVASYQSRFVPREFEKGVYNGKQINIYEFNNLPELRLVIAHELGHALGLGHNNAPYALMYPMMQHQNINDFQLTQADIALLSR